MRTEPIVGRRRASMAAVTACGAVQAVGTARSHTGRAARTAAGQQVPWQLDDVERSYIVMP